MRPSNSSARTKLLLPDPLAPTSTLRAPRSTRACRIDVWPSISTERIRGGVMTPPYESADLRIGMTGRRSAATLPGSPRPARRRSRVRGLALAVQPGPEKAGQGTPGDVLGQRLELRGRPGAEPLRGRPTAQDRGERALPDGHPQRLQRHRAALVHRLAEQPARPRVAGRRMPDRAGVRRRVHPVEVLRDGTPADVFVPQPLGVRREALVQPDVAPVVQG